MWCGRKWVRERSCRAVEEVGRACLMHQVVDAFKSVERGRLCEV